MVYSNTKVFKCLCYGTYVEEVKEMGSLKEEEGRHIRVMYEAIYEEPRILQKKIAELLHVSAYKVSAILEKAVELGYISKTQIRPRSYRNLKEFVYFLKCDNSADYFSELVDSEKVIYHATTGGCTNMWVVAREELDFSCKNVVSGPRSDYHVSFPPYHSWETAIRKMHKMVVEFNPKDYEPQGIIKTRWNETVEWDPEYEALLREFKFDLTKPINPIMRNNLISWTKVEKWLKNVSTYCTIITGYYPEGLGSYDPYLFVLETGYEDFIIKLFSELPTTTLFFKVSNKLFFLAYVKRDYMRFKSSQIDITELQIPSMLIKLNRKDVIRKESHGIVECYWLKGIHPGIPP